MILNTELKNGQIDISDICMDISQYGIYLLQGENGSGKSSLVKKIVFGENRAIFHTSEHEAKYNGKRYEIISYVEQDPVPYSSTIEKYVLKSCAKGSKEELITLMNKFNMAGLDLQSNVKKLSGGEIVKLNIIAALLKKTPYIIMDEPTNNLDNPSVVEFISIIEEFAKNHTILIVSHDPRVKFKEYAIMRIENNSLRTIKSFHAEKNTAGTVQLSYPRKRLLGEYICSPNFLGSAIGIILMLVVCVFVNLILYAVIMNNEDIPDIEDIIVTYKVDMQYDELNQNYVKYEGLNIDENQSYRMIYFDDLETIYNRADVDKIVLPDTEYIEGIKEEMAKIREEGDLLEKLPVFAVPNDVLNNFGDQILLPCDVRMLRKGRLPKDNANEVVISEELLTKVYHIQPDESIGEKIRINQKEYKIVGIGYFDLCVVSFEEQDEFGYFVYQSKKSDGKIKKLQKYLEQEEYYISDALYNNIIYTKKNCEKEVLDSLIITYPAENYVSKEFETAYKSYINRGGKLILGMMNVLLAVIFSFSILSTFRKTIEYQKDKAQSFDNYFCMNNKTMDLYRKSSCAYLFGCIVIMLLIVTITSRYILWYIFGNSILTYGIFLLRIGKR